MTEPVRVLSLVSSLCIGGAEKHAVALLNRLDTQHFALSLAYLRPVEELLPQVQHERLQRIVSLKAAGKLDWGVVQRLVRLIDEDRIDLVLCTCEYPALYAWLACRRAHRRPKLVEVFHTTEYRTLKEKAQMLLYRRLFRFFDLLVYVSRNQQVYWRARRVRAARDTVIHNGIDPEVFCDRYSFDEKRDLRRRLSLDERDYVVAICAAMRPEKAHADLIRALARLHGAGIMAKVLIIGDGPERSNVELLVRQLDLQASVVVTGFQSDVRPFLACSDVVVLPSHAIETFSIAVLEAMALAKPMVLTHIGGADEQITHGIEGLLFAAGDLDALTAHLIALSDAEKRRAMGDAAARKVREHFSEQRMIDAFAAELTTLTAHQTVQ